MLLFDGVLGGYVNMMPVSWIDDHYSDLVTGGLVHLFRYDRAIDINEGGTTDAD